MKYGYLPGGPPQRQRSSPVKVVASHILSQMRRPGRIRSRLFLLSLALFGTLFIGYGRRHPTELYFTASTLTNYIPTSITDAIAMYGEDEDTRWDDTNTNTDSKNGSEHNNHIVIKKPKFHLLIPAYKPSASLCRSLLSAAILNYPPPTLINYGGPPDSERPGMDVVKSTFNFLLGKELRDDDLVLIVEESTWFQLPAEVTLSRFFRTLQDSSTNLLNKYGPVPNSNGSHIPRHQRPQKYTPKLLFSAAKSCSDTPDSPACLSIPESPLPKHISDSQTNENSEPASHPPHYISPSLQIGRVSSLLPLYKRVSEILEIEIKDVGISAQGSQHIFSHLFGEQEYARSEYLEEERARRPVWRNWFADHIFSKPSKGAIIKPNITLPPNQPHEFGITLDYYSSISQDMQDSVQDMQFVTFDDQLKNSAPARVGAKTWRIKHPLHIPSDLLTAPGPFRWEEISSATSDLGSETDMQEKALMGEDAKWSDIPLLTNTMVPSSSVPAALNFHITDNPTDRDEIWSKFWFHNTSRSLLTQHIQIHSSSSTPEPLIISTSIPGVEAGKDADAESGPHYFDIRNGKSPIGVWTDRGEWIPWKDVCGGFEEGVFGDGLGALKTESEGGKAGEGKGEDVGEGLVKGLWSMVVGGKEEGKEKSTGNGDVVGGFGQGESVVSEHLLQGEDKNGEFSEDKHENKDEGKEEEKDGIDKDEDGKNEDAQKDEVKDDDIKDNEKDDETKNGNNNKDDDNKGDDHKTELENNDGMKNKDHESVDGSNGKTDEEGKVEEGAVRYEDENDEKKNEQKADSKQESDIKKKK